MKIKTKELVRFLKKFRMSGKQEIEEATFKFGADGLKLNANSPAKLSRAIAWLKTSGFVEYEEIGNIGLNDLENVVKVFERFGEDLSMKKEGNLLTIKGGNKKVDIALISENYLETDSEEPALEFTETFTTDAATLKEIIKDIKMNEDATLTITTKEKKVIITNTGKYKFENTIEAPTCKGGVVVKFGLPFIEAVANLDGALEISLAEDYPIKIMEKSETSVVTIIVAPRVDTE